MHPDIIKKLDKIVSAIILISIFMLIAFTLAFFVKGFFNIAHEFITEQEPPTERIFHGIAVILIFVKAYKILVSYYLDHHISIRLIVEIAIIATTIEILFNAKNLELPLLIVLAFYGIANLIVYLVFQNKFEATEH